MSITFHPVLRKNPRNLADPGKYYPNPVYKGKLNSHDVSKIISSRTSLSTTDCLAVLYAMSSVLPELLSDGYIVNLNEFGTLRLTFEGEGCALKKEVTQNKIKSIRINFLPGKELRDEVTSITPQTEKPDKKGKKK